MFTRHFEKEMHNLKKKVLSLSALVESCVRKAVKVVETRDEVLAAKVIGLDCEIDEKEVEVEEECLKVLALYHPVAVDLRFLIAVIKVNSDLERIADEAVNIALLVLGMSRRKRLNAYHDFTAICKRTEHMLSQSLDALVNMDVELAIRVCMLDRDVDRMYAEVNCGMREKIRRGSEDLEHLMDLTMIARHLERIGDHATNIAEEVVYLVEGKIVRHRIPTTPTDLIRRPEDFAELRSARISRPA